MAEYVIYESRTATVLGAPVSLVGGQVITDAQYSIQALIAAGFKMVQLNLAPPGGGLRIARQVITATGVYTPTVGATAALLRMVGGGGAGGGAIGGASTASAGAGGASAWYFEKWIAPGVQLIGGAATIGAGGVGAAGASGTAGGATSVAIHGVTYTAPGGSGSGAGPATTTNALAVPGAPTAIGSVGDVNFQSPGDMGIVVPGAWLSGSGGSSPFGGGGFSVSGANDGLAATGYGAGGGGATATTVSRPGGPGSPGLILIDEYA